MDKLRRVLSGREENEELGLTAQVLRTKMAFRVTLMSSTAEVCFYELFETEYFHFVKCNINIVINQ